MSSVPEISVVQIPSPAEHEQGPAHAGPPVATWSPVELPPAARPSPVWLAVLALLAGIAAMALGALAVVSATRSGDTPTAPTTAPAALSSATSSTERRVLALLAKPSTRRIAFTGSGGRLVLAVGSAGKAAILIRGLERAPASRPYLAWVLESDTATRAAAFTGAERAVFLAVAVRPGAKVVIARDRLAALRPGALVAVRD